MTQTYNGNSPALDALISIEGWETSALVREMARGEDNCRMKELLSLAQQWSDYADRLRVTAEESPADTKQHLLDAASRWTEMARKAKLLAEREKPHPVETSRAA